MLEFRVLGTVGALRDGQPVTINSRQARAVLASLLTKPNTACTRDALVDAVWGEDIPDRAHELLRSIVSRLRRANGALTPHLPRRAGIRRPDPARPGRRRRQLGAGRQHPRTVRIG